MTLLDGDYVPVIETAGRPVAVMFWASWCSGSRSTIDDYEELARQYRTLQFVAISLDSADSEQKLRSFIQENDLYTIRHAYSGNKYQDEAAMAFEVDEIPYFYLINTHKQLVYSGGSVGDLEDAIGELR